MIYKINPDTQQIHEFISVNNIGVQASQWQNATQDEINNFILQEELKKQKTNKENELAIAYEEAQYIKIQNGHTFIVQLKS